VWFKKAANGRLFCLQQSCGRIQLRGVDFVLGRLEVKIPPYPKGRQKGWALHPGVKLAPMSIEIHDPGLEARLRKQAESTGSGSIEEFLTLLLETKEEHDRWLAENQPRIGPRIQRGLDQLDRGEGIPEHRLNSYLDRLKAKQGS
jgi:hypothetical protein